MTLSSVFKIAFVTSPCSIKLMVSIEKVENVVNAPKNPTNSIALTSGDTDIL
jgi:hypothetical protein